MTQTLNMCHSSHFSAFFPVKINKMLHKFLALCLTPPDKKWKKTFINLNREKVFWKGLKICTYRFWGMPTAMHYVRTLCDKYFLSYDGFSWFPLTGRFRHRVLKHGCKGRMGCKEDCCICPIPFWWYLTPFYATCLLKFWFFRNCLS